VSLPVPFTVNDFRDLLAILGTHPEWRDELRRLVLADELLTLPVSLRELAAAQQRTEQRLAELVVRVDALAAAQQRTEQRLAELVVRVDALAAAQQRTEQRIEELAARVDTLAARMDSLAAHMDELAASQLQMAIRLDTLRGGVLELRFHERGAPALGLLGFRRVRVLSGAERLDLADEALESGRITDEERAALLRLDAVARGRDAAGDVWFAVEVSATGDRHDVERAEDRARVLAKAVERARPVVAAIRFTEGAEARRQADADLLLVPLPED
jgi:chaperonin cofactor prefoldin